MDDYFTFLSHNGYRNLRNLPGRRWAATAEFAFTTAIIMGHRDDMYGYSDRWCYHTLADATEALLQWDGEGEPEGWHRHPGTGRRRPDGDPDQEYINP